MMSKRIEPHNETDSRWERGQDLAEYSLFLGLIALVVVISVVPLEQILAQLL